MSGDNVMSGKPPAGKRTAGMAAMQPGIPANPHFISTAPFDPNAVEAMTPEQEKVFLASQLKLMWWKFRKHKLALASGIFLLIVYLSIMIAEFLAPYSLETRNARAIYRSPTPVHFFHEGAFIGPYS